MKESYRNIYIFNNNFLSNEEQMKLLELLYSDDDDLKNIVAWKLVLANIGLIHDVVMGFLKHNCKVDYDDLMSLGIIGAFRSIDKYDSSKGKLSTFLSSCVKNCILGPLRYIPTHP